VWKARDLQAGGADHPQQRLAAQDRWRPGGGARRLGEIEADHPARSAASLSTETDLLVGVQERQAVGAEPREAQNEISITFQVEDGKESLL
jgi:hypothetical protein